MLVLVLGDTHIYDRTYIFPKFLYKWIEKADQVWHTGDVTSEEFYDELKTVCGDKLKLVVGNGDSGSIVRENPIEYIWEMYGYRIWLHHGHEYDLPRYDLRAMVSKAKEKEADVCIFGHWHQPLSRKLSGVWLVNPGSTCDSKQFGVGGFALLHFDEEYGMRVSIQTYDTSKLVPGKK
ncbi:MAG: metallophosphoesterase [Patescibacteria group bacterium]|nr:metallophosphoesterase [Patescibacteria group bacterium]